MARLALEERARYANELLGVRPNERVVSTIDDHQLRASDAVMQHMRVVERHGLIVRAGDNERRASDLGRASPQERRPRPARSEVEAL